MFFRLFSGCFFNRIAPSKHRGHKMTVDAYQVAIACCAAAIGDISKLKTLPVEVLKHGDYDRRTPLHVAASEGHADCVAFLAEKGVDINPKDRWGGTPLQDAMREGHKSIVSILQKHGGHVADMTRFVDEFLRASAAGDIPVLKRLLDAGVKINQGDYDKRTALHLAASEGQLAVVEFLLDHGANVASTDRFGGTPLLDAIRHKHDAVASVLRDHGATIEESESINTALLSACGAGDFDAVCRLVTSGASVNVADYDQRSALHIAASEGEFRIVEYLVSRGAKTTIMDRWGGTPLGDAIRHNQNKIAVFLKKHEAKLSDKEGNLINKQPSRDFVKNQEEAPKFDEDHLRDLTEKQILQQMIKFYGHHQFQQQCLKILIEKLEKDADHSKKRALVAEDGINLLISLLREESADLILLKNAYLALGKFGEVDEHAVQIHGQGGVDLALHGLRHEGYDVETKLHAASVLSNITFPESHGLEQTIEEFVRSRGIATVLESLNTYNANKDICAKLATIIWNVCSFDVSSIDRVIKESGLNAICKAWKLHQRTGVAVEAFAGAISCLIQNDGELVNFLDSCRGAKLIMESYRMHEKDKRVIAAISKLAADSCRKPKKGPQPTRTIAKLLLKDVEYVKNIIISMKTCENDISVQENCACLLACTVRVTERPEQVVHTIKKAGGEKALRDTQARFPNSAIINDLLTDIKDLDKCVIC